MVEGIKRQSKCVLYASTKKKKNANRGTMRGAKLFFFSSLRWLRTFGKERRIIDWFTTFCFLGERVLLFTAEPLQLPSPAKNQVLRSNHHNLVHFNDSVKTVLEWLAYSKRFSERLFQYGEPISMITFFDFLAGAPCCQLFMPIPIISYLCVPCDG